MVISGQNTAWVMLHDYLSTCIFLDLGSRHSKHCKSGIIAVSVFGSFEETDSRLKIIGFEFSGSYDLASELDSTAENIFYSAACATTVLLALSLGSIPGCVAKAIELTLIVIIITAIRISCVVTI